MVRYFEELLVYHNKLSNKTRNIPTTFFYLFRLSERRQLVTMT